MTAVDNRPTRRRTHVTPYTMERRIMGTPAEVASTVDRLRRSGQLLAITRPRLMPGSDSRVYVLVRLLATPVRSTREAATARRLLRVAGRVAVVVVPVTGAAFAVVYALSRLVAALLPLLPYLGIGLIAALLVWRALGRVGVCAGLHCPGCSHGGHR